MEVGVPFIDGRILYTGISPGSVVVLRGEPGTGKTTFTFQWMCSLSRQGKKSLFISTLGEPAIKIFSDMSKFSFFSKELTENFAMASLEDFLFSPKAEDIAAKIDELIEGFSPDFVFIDSYKAVESLLSREEVRKLTYSLSVKNSLRGISTVLVGEWVNGKDTPVVYIADVIFTFEKKIFNNYERKYFRVDKLRGGDFFAGNHPLVITSDGITVYPRIKVEPYNVEVNPQDRCSFGVDGVDKLLTGGLIRGTTAVVKGYAGLGKTTLCLHFLISGAEKGEKGLHISFQEPPGSIESNGETLGLPVKKYRDKGLIDLVFITPTEVDPDLLSFKMIEIIKNGGYRRVTIDSIFDVVSRIPNKVRLVDLIYSLVHFFKKNGITAVFTKELVPGGNEDYGISYMADAFILLKYVPIKGVIKRVIGVVKARGTPVGNVFYTYRIEKGGIKLEKRLEEGSVEINEF
ncbi:circadian clock protein KaiC [Desulfurobacterium pacificum]|uniref:Circadian clock protein KaiC n=1 Tax=Desulfurobacterium pacificum TaxID=240166 RepID=A0ABY1NF92_9BACT|nr:ATPase domain-containing protein [Desulfurobacterium pacificum]SMP08151.1 circadian clock protein KaiC [Desulfurobacterium pacificum]